MISKRLHPASFSNVNAQLAQIANYSNKFSTDFFGTIFVPWSFSALASGTAPINNAVLEKLHQGIANITSSTNANSGYRYYTGSADLKITGGEKSTFIFKTPTIDSNSVVRFGFQTPVDHNTQIYQVAINITGTTLSGKTSNSSTETTTASTYTLTNNTWYRAVLTVNSNATSVLFELYADNSTTLLWSDTITTNIPANTPMYHGLVAYNTSTVSKLIVYADYMDFELQDMRRVE